jgi:site-specific DNA recombinase
MSESIIKLAIAYIRMSTDKQAISPAMQEERILAWATANGFEVVAIYRDMAKSGSTTENRPELEKAIQHASQIRGVLVSYKLDRWARSVADASAIASRLRKNGAGMVSITESFDTTTDAGRLLYNILAAVAEFERDCIVSRTKAALSHLRSTGKVFGAIPYGRIRNGDDLVECPEEQDIIVRMRTMRAAGNGYRLVARTLNNDGVKAKSGGDWSPQAVKSVLERCEVNHAS